MNKSVIKKFFRLDKDDAIKSAEKSRLMRENLQENQIDKMIDDSFPASDPPSTY